MWDGLLNVWGKAMDNNFQQNGVSTTKKRLSQEAIDKLIYDVMSSDQGLASIGSKENLVGGSNSSSKGLMAQDLMTKIIGELANMTAETEVATSTEKTTKEGRTLDKTIGGKGSVICSVLQEQGRIPNDYYARAGKAYSQVAYYTWRGYYVWAKYVAARIENSPQLGNLLLPVVLARYQQLLGEKRSILGSLAIYIGHPICNLIGRSIYVYAEIKHTVTTVGGQYGRRAE